MDSPPVESPLSETANPAPLMPIPSRESVGGVSSHTGNRATTLNSPDDGACPPGSISSGPLKRRSTVTASRPVVPATSPPGLCTVKVRDLSSRLNP